MIHGLMVDVFFPVPTMGADFFSRYLTTSSTLSAESTLMMNLFISSCMVFCLPADRSASWVDSRLSSCFRRCEGRTGGVRGLGGGATCGVNVPSGLWR